MVDQNLDPQNYPNNSTNIYKSRLLCESICSVCPTAYQNFIQKRRHWRHGRPESRRSDPPQRFSPFQQITTNPGYCVIPSIPSARLPIRILNWRHGGPESRGSEQPQQFSPFQQIEVTAWICLYHLPGYLSEFWTKKDVTDARGEQDLDV